MIRWLRRLLWRWKARPRGDAEVFENPRRRVR